MEDKKQIKMSLKVVVLVIVIGIIVTIATILIANRNDGNSNTIAQGNNTNELNASNSNTFNSNGTTGNSGQNSSASHKLVEDSELDIFLSRIASFNRAVDKSQQYFTVPEIKLNICSEYAHSFVNDSEKISFKAEEIRSAMKEVFNEEVDTSVVGILELTYDAEADCYTFEAAGDVNVGTSLVAVENQSYLDGIYTVTYLYTYIDESDIIGASSDAEINEIISNYNCYRTQIQLRINNSYKFSKYQLVSTDITSSLAGLVKDFE